MRKTLIGLVAALVVLTGAAVAFAQTSGDETTTTTTEGTDEQPRVDRKLDFLSDVLDGLVAGGTITQAQATAILEAVEAEAEARIAEREAVREQIGGFLEDGVITAEEIAQLPEEHPFRDPDGPASELLEDGQITAAELFELWPGPGRHHRGGFGSGGSAATDT